VFAAFGFIFQLENLQVFLFWNNICNRIMLCFYQGKNNGAIKHMRF